MTSIPVTRANLVAAPATLTSAFVGEVLNALPAKRQLLPLPTTSTMEQLRFSGRGGVTSWAQAHIGQVEAAIGYLRSIGILCSRLERESAVARYRLTGHDQSISAHDVIAFAKRKGFAG